MDAVQRVVIFLVRPSSAFIPTRRENSRGVPPTSGSEWGSFSLCLVSCWRSLETEPKASPCEIASNHGLSLGRMCEKTSILSALSKPRSEPF